MKRVLCNSVVVLACFIVPCAARVDMRAEIIGPVGTDIPIPDAIMSELDEGVAKQLKPLMRLFVSNDFATFKAEYSKIAATTDTLPAAQVFWAKLLVQGNRFPDAIRLLEEYGRDHRDDPEFYITMGVLAAKSGRFTDGWFHLRYAQNLIDRDGLTKSRRDLILPNFIDARCIVAENGHRWGEADKMYLLLQSLRPEDHSVTWRAGRCKVLAGKIDEGHQQMAQAYQANAKLPPATLAVAQILSDSTNWSTNQEQAAVVESWFTKSINENSADDKAWAAYFKWLLLYDKPGVVRDQFESLTNELKAAREVVLFRAVAARYLGELDVAEELLTPLNQGRPDDLEISDQLALVLVESQDQSKREAARQISEKNFRAASSLETIAATAAWVQLKLGNDDVADKVLTQLVARGPLSAQTTYYVAELLRTSGRTADSQKLLRTAVNLVGLFPQRSSARKLLDESE